MIDCKKISRDIRVVYAVLSVIILVLVVLCECNVVPIVNDYFGHEITVAGLLTATDLINQLKGKKLGDRLLLPSAMFRSEGDVTLDDYSWEDIENALGVKVVQVSNDGFELLNAILDV